MAIEDYRTLSYAHGTTPLIRRTGAVTAALTADLDLAGGALIIPRGAGTINFTPVDDTSTRQKTNPTQNRYLGEGDAFLWIPYVVSRVLMTGTTITSFSIIYI